MTEPEIDQALRACSRLEPGSGWLSATKALLAREKRRRFRSRWVRGAAAIALIGFSLVGAVFRGNSLQQTEFKDLNFQLLIHTRVSPLVAKFRWYRISGGILDAKEDWAIRYVCDSRTETVRGYEFRTTLLPQERYRFETRAITGDLRIDLESRFPGLRWAGIESIPKLSEVASGEKFEIELAREGTSRVYDELQIVSTVQAGR